MILNLDIHNFSCYFSHENPLIPTIASHTQSTMSNPLFTRIGVINWDCSVPSETTFFGRYATRSLGPREFRDRTPYYAIETGPDTILYRERTVADYEIELRHAIAAGIDYFAYCWYDREPHSDHVVDGSATTVDDTVCELVDARMKHLASPLRCKIGLCAILITCHPYTDEELADLAETMKEPYYEKIDGRPLVYLFAGPWQELIERLRKICKNAGVADPYAVLMADRVSPEDAMKVQALSSYAGATAQGRTWNEFFDNELARNDVRAGNGLPVVPHFSMGWNPTPRIKHTVPWTSYPDGVYAPPATVEELFAAAKRLKSWTEEHRATCPTGHVLTFAWNEFEEGAWICPTFGKDAATPDTHYRDAFAQIAANWKR